MSKTDKDRPYHVRTFFEGHIEHDHREGVCRPASMGDTWRWSTHNCTRYETIEYECPGFSYGQKFTYNFRSGPAATCYALRREFDDEYRAIESGDFRASWLLSQRWRKTRFCGVTHTYRKFHKDWACETCETRPTCYYWANHRPYRWSVRNVPKWFVDHTWNNPERVRERDTFRNMVKDYNTNFGDAELDFDNPQHRHRSRWHWD
jgi:hypothetical protein